MLEIKRIITGKLKENCYLVYNDKTMLIIDPGSDPGKIEAEIEALNRRPVAILLTHTHYDHIGAVSEIRKKYRIPVYVHPHEQEWLSDPDYNGSRVVGSSEIVVEPAEEEFKTGMYNLGEIAFKVVPTPGHSHGSVSFIFDSFAVVGDALFKRRIGRTDFYTGDYETLIHSITTELFVLPQEMKVYPGHGEMTTIGEEKTSNPHFN